MVGLTVSDEYELLALHRALLEAKFSTEPKDPAVVGSPHVANIANRIVDLLSELDADWLEWRKFEKHPDKVDFVISKIRTSRRWPSMAIEQRAEYALSLASPFIVSDSQLAELLCLTVLE